MSPVRVGPPVEPTVLGVDGLRRYPVPGASPAEEVGRWLARELAGRLATREEAELVAALGTEYVRAFGLGERVEVRPARKVITEDAGWVRLLSGRGWYWSSEKVSREVNDWSRLSVAVVREGTP